MIAKLNEFISRIAAAVLAFLPNSPFSDAIASIANVTWLKYINWFVPIGTLVGIGTVWLTAIGVFYIYQAILRWAKVVGD